MGRDKARYVTARFLIPPVEHRCDQEVSKRTLATLHKVCEEVSNKEIRNHFEPRDVRVSLPRRADE